MHRPRISARLNILLLNVDMNEYYLCSNVISTLINEQQFTELATNGRSIVALATLGLGVSGNLPDSNTPTSVGVGLRRSIRATRLGFQTRRLAQR